MANKKKNENNKSVDAAPSQEETLQTVDESNTDAVPDVPQVSDPSADTAEGAGTQVLFSAEMETEASAGDWGDSVPGNPLPYPTPPDMFTESDESLAPVPQELLYLTNIGVRFARVPESCWKVSQSNAKLYKDRSVYFSVDTVCTSHDILFGFDKAGIDIDRITSVQRRNSNRSWVVSFCTFEDKECALEIGRVTVCGIEVFLGDAQFRTVLVKIYECPSEMPDTVVIGRLSKYGRVLSFRRDKIGDVIFNGVRTARMRLAHHIPCSINVVGEPIIIYYESQPRTCRRCGDTGHLAQNCRASRCFNCDQPGHRRENCPEVLLCSACFCADHGTPVCPFILHSGNVQPPADGDTPTTYAAAAVSAPAEPRAPRQSQGKTQEKGARAGGANAPEKPVKANAEKTERSKRDDGASRGNNSGQSRNDKSGNNRRREDEDNRKRDENNRRRDEDNRSRDDDNRKRADGRDKDDRDRRYRNRDRDDSRERSRHDGRGRDWSRSRDRYRDRDHDRDRHHDRDRDRHRHYRDYSSESDHR